MGLTAVLMPKSAAEYGALARRLLPRGTAWLGDILGSFLDGVAVEFSRIEARALQVIDEANPLTALELLPDWEALAGLPDTCAPIGDSIRDRQIAIARKLTEKGSLSRADLIELASRIGVLIEIDEYLPATVDSNCTDYLFTDDWTGSFEVRVLPESAILSQTDVLLDSWATVDSGCDEFLRSFGIESLECLILRAMPADCFVFFIYPDDATPILWFDHLSSQGIY